MAREGLGTRLRSAGSNRNVTHSKIIATRVADSLLPSLARAVRALNYKVLGSRVICYSTCISSKRLINLYRETGMKAATHNDVLYNLPAHLQLKLV